MNQKDYLLEFEKLLTEELATTKAKSTDYAKHDDAFANFRQIEILSGGRISVEDGLLCRISDKLSRVANLINKKAAVVDESIDDTLKDISIYCRIWRIYRARNESRMESANICFCDVSKEGHEKTCKQYVDKQVETYLKQSNSITKHARACTCDDCCKGRNPTNGKEVF